MQLQIRKIDWSLLIIPIILVCLGMLTFYFLNPPNTNILIRQLVLMSLGVISMFLGSLFDYKIFKNNSMPSIVFYVFSIILMLIALTSPVIRGTQAWTTILGIQFQPSELAKLATLILLAKYFSQKHVEIYNAKHIIISGIYAAIPSSIALLQSDFGSMIIFVGLWFGMLLFAGLNKKHLLGLLIISVVIATIGWFLILKPYQQDRLISFINPYSDPQGSGFNVLQSQITLGSGQWFGSVFEGREDQLSVTVPEPYNDFVFAAFGQKFGFVGLVILLILIIILLLRIGSTALKTQNNFAQLFALGLMTFILLHIIINVGMNLGLMPITGIPLPFVSQGGSHLITLMLGLGLIQSIRLRTI